MDVRRTESLISKVSQQLRHRDWFH